MHLLSYSKYNKNMEIFQNKYDTKKIVTYFCIVALLCYFLPFIILGEEAYFTIHDNLNCEFTYLHILSKTNTSFNYDRVLTIPQIMNGLPRCFLRSGLSCYGCEIADAEKTTDIGSTRQRLSRLCS